MIPAARVAILASGWLAFASTGWAGDVLDRIRRDGVLHCAALERPGLAEIEDGKPAGRAADLCRNVAEQILGPGGRYGLTLLDLDSDYDKVRRGEVDLAFLEPRVVGAQNLGGVLKPAGEAYRDAFAVLVPLASRRSNLSDLRGAMICFMIGDPIWPVLNEAMQARGIRFRPYGFSEDVEMRDAYNVGRCDAVAGPTSTLAEISRDGGVRHLKSRLLDEKLGPDPVYAMVPAGDDRWAGFVAERWSRVSQPAR